MRSQAECDGQARMSAGEDQGDRAAAARPRQMQIGVVFPQTEIGADPGAVRAYGQRVEELGFEHLLAYDHVLGADPAGHPGWSGPYDVRTTFHEPLVLFGYLAALTSLELVTGIIILPQRQTALVAKQAAEVDLLTGGHLRLGIGLGWNAVEYEALGKSFRNRGARMSEQVRLLRQLWSEPAVTFAGEHEQVTAAGLAPLPVQRPIPLWFGAHSRPAYERAGRLGDGWFPQVPPGPRLDEARAVVERAAADAGRDPAALGMEGRVSWTAGGAEKLADHAGRWRDAGATHLSVNTMGAGFDSVDQHLAALASAAAALSLPRA
ncbi:MAG TPA: LLM class F420-dependent oxidoreductase [Streptosporangiaceae bacterium]